MGWHCFCIPMSNNRDAHTASQVDPTVSGVSFLDGASSDHELEYYGQIKD